MLEVFNHKVGRIQDIERAGVALAKTVIAGQQVSASCEFRGGGVQSINGFHPNRFQIARSLSDLWCQFDFLGCEFEALLYPKTASLL
ncbi:MAG: hypothetical protein NWT08_14390 [Akkermansiaceae bacterium]|nr:hypothetical protein [Akkermansiaceae bacterium]MDP4646706.1 hypothetical protein [Akkermansiaceae bacterium]MDP4779622.1 hypothetical protein [Akkermansiaceae bacterium]MDP4846298.1 hypothetical protein [Akkermansiaceae bacterium]MDP4896936.1 hypothetical protein [Akkermansiaceae bacterium]